jgi:uncharacterized protein (DUF2236 family)
MLFAANLVSRLVPPVYNAAQPMALYQPTSRTTKLAARELKPPWIRALTWMSMTVGQQKGQVWSAGQVNLIDWMGEKKVFTTWVTLKVPQSNLCTTREPKKW